MEEIDLEVLPEPVRLLLLKQAEDLAKQAVYSIEQFWKSGLGGMELSRRSASASTYTSTHTAVNMFDVQDVGIFDNIEAHNLSMASEYLLALRNQDCKTRISYFNEAEIEDYVRRIVRDVMYFLGVNMELSIHYQATLVCMVETSRRESKSDIWVVKTKSGVPITVIEVKQPEKSKLSDDKVLGQIFDYMSNLRNSFGQCEMFGILTTLDAWRVVWFPDTDDFAASKDLNPPMYEDLYTQFPVASTLERHLHGSEVYSWDDSQVLPLIGTVLLKSMQSQYRVVSLLTSQRAYTILSEKNWRWGTISNTDLMGHTAITLALPNYEPNHVIVLRQFHGGADGQVCLALTKDFNLVVVKKFYYEKLCEKELNVWREVYGVGVFSTVLLIHIVSSCRLYSIA